MADTTTVLEFMKDMISEIKDLAPEEITPETTIDELGFDSLDYVEIKVNVSREFLVTLTPTLFESIQTIRQLCDYIAKESASLEA
jgi:acyl carrier protein